MDAGNWALIGALVFVFALLLAMSLCRMAADADRDMKSPNKKE